MLGYTDASGLCKRALIEGKGGLPVIVRSDLPQAEMPDEAAPRVIAIRHVAPADPTKEALQMIVSSLQAAAASVADVQLCTVEADGARRSARAMALPLRQLTQLRQSLIMRRL
jgi:hypothetical protein